MNDKKGKSTSGNQGQGKPLSEDFGVGKVGGNEITRSLGPRQPTGGKPDNSDKGGGGKQGD